MAAPGSADGSHCCSQVTCSRLCSRPSCSARDYSRARGLAMLAHCHSGMHRRVHTPTLVPPHDIHHGSPSPAASAILSTPQHGHDASHFACAHTLTLTGGQVGVKHRLAHLACAALFSSTWLLFCSLLSALLRLATARLAALPLARRGSSRLASLLAHVA